MVESLLETRRQAADPHRAVRSSTRDRLKENSVSGERSVGRESGERGDRSIVGKPGGRIGHPEIASGNRPGREGARGRVQQVNRELRLAATRPTGSKVRVKVRRSGVQGLSLPKMKARTN